MCWNSSRDTHFLHFPTRDLIKHLFYLCPIRTVVSRFAAAPDSDPSSASVLFLELHSSRPMRYGFRKGTWESQSERRRCWCWWRGNTSRFYPVLMDVVMCVLPEMLGKLEGLLYVPGFPSRINSALLYSFIYLFKKKNNEISAKTLSRMNVSVKSGFYKVAVGISSVLLFTEEISKYFDLNRLLN